MGGWQSGIPENNFKKFQWRTKGANCPICNIMQGRVYTLEIYMTSSVYPGFHPHCNCYLSPVPDDSPMSDIDIFGSSLDMLAHGWLDLLMGHPENLWMSGNTRFARDIINLSKPGMTFKEALDLYSKRHDSSLFPDRGIFDFLGWAVWKNSTPDIYKSAEEIFTSISGLIPSARHLKPTLPAQSYHDTIYNLGWGR